MKRLFACLQVISLTGRVLGSSELSVIEDTVIIDRLDVELVSGVQLSVEAKSDFPGAIAAQVTKTYQLHTYLQVLSTPHILPTQLQRLITGLSPLCGLLGNYLIGFTARGSDDSTRIVFSIVAKFFSLLTR